MKSAVGMISLWVFSLIFVGGKPLLADEPVLSSQVIAARQKGDCNSFCAPCTPSLPIQQVSSPCPPMARIFKYRPLLNKHYGYINADLLVWSVAQGQLDYAIKNATTPPITGAFAGMTAQTGRILECKYDVQTGFRVGLGGVVTPDYWDLEAQYTYIAPSGSARADRKSGQGFYGTLTQYTGIESLYATATTSLKYHVADLLLAKRFRLSKQILLRWQMGGVGAWIYHQFQANYYPSVASDSYVCKNLLKWRFEGGGFKTGVAADWFFGKGLSLTGLFTAGLLYGNYHNQYRAVSTPTVSGIIYTPQNNVMNNQRLVYTNQMLIGPSFGWRFPCWGFKLLAAYELNLWYNVQKVLYSEYESGPASDRESRYSSENLGLEGFTLHADVYF